MTVVTCQEEIWSKFGEIWRLGAFLGFDGQSAGPPYRSAAPI